MVGNPWPLELQAQGSPCTERTPTVPSAMPSCRCQVCQLGYCAPHFDSGPLPPPQLPLAQLPEEKADLYDQVFTAALEHFGNSLEDREECIGEAVKFADVFVATEVATFSMTRTSRGLRVTPQTTPATNSCCGAETTEEQYPANRPKEWRGTTSSSNQE